MLYAWPIRLLGRIGRIKRELKGKRIKRNKKDTHVSKHNTHRELKHRELKGHPR